MSKKVILITGASSGMGKVTAEKLLEQGHIVYVGARRIEKMQDLESKGGKLLKLDVSNEASCEQAVKQVIETEGRVDVLFNNAGFGLYGAVEDISLEDARYQFDVNMFGLAKMTQLVLPHMRKQKSGKIINTSSMGGKIYTPLGAWYHATKHAVEGWSDCLRLEVAPFGIDVVVIEPGIILTDFGNVVSGPLMKNSGKGAYKMMAEQVARGTENSYGQGRGSKPELIADIVVKAIHSKSPKTRYLAGTLAKPLVYIRKIFGDKVYDRLIMSQVK